MGPILDAWLFLAVAIASSFQFSEGQLRRACQQFTAHYHRERPHQGLANQLIDGSAIATSDNGEVLCDERLGGLLEFCRRAAGCVMSASSWPGAWRGASVPG